MSKKRILIPGWSTGDASFGVSKAYLEYFSQFGQVDILTPREDIIECDMLVLPGGMDTLSSNYGEKPSFFAGSADTFKEYFYKQNLSQYIEAKIPIVGICLGLQMLGAYFGSKITQHMYHEQSNPRGELVHEIYPVVGERVNKLYNYTKEKKYSFKVNSLHHQAISQVDLADCLKPLYLDEDGWFVEMFEHRELPIFACQYHPEEIYDTVTIKKIQTLIDGKR